MQDTRPAFRASALILALLALAGCSGTGLEWPGTTKTPEAAATPPGAAPVNLAGIWMLSSPGRGQCRMTFGSAAPAAAEGTIAPQGGCPGKFYMSRKWTFESGSLVMRDHNGQPLAQLANEGATFEGKATGGEPVTLQR
jgi:hypothetical protein